MIPRYQRLLFWSLALAILLMAIFLLHGCQQAREKLNRQQNQTPLAAPAETAPETFHLAMASDADNSIALVDRQLALPSESTARTRALLAQLIAEYSYKNSTHPLASGPAVDDVFLLDLPLKPATSSNPADHSGNPSSESPTPSDIPHSPGGQLVVINLSAAFADHHPSGIEAETLTINSIVGTLFANFPRIEQVRFVVNGQPRDTLAGHADLTRTYQVVNTATAGAAQ
jgi:sporulation and spore germination protein